MRLNGIYDEQCNTYIAIAKMRSKPTAEITTLLERAKQKARAKNWLEVNYYLQQLPVFTTKTGLENIDRETIEQIIHLALSSLIQGDFEQKWHIAKIFPLIEAPAILPLIAITEDETIDTETKWFVARILGNFKKPEAVVALAKLLQNTKEADLIAICAKSLAAIGTPAIAVLTELLNKPEYRLVAAKSLAHIRLTSVLPTLLKLAKDKNPEIRLLAIEALGSFRDRQIIAVLVKALKDTHSAIRKEAVIALGFGANFNTEWDLVSCLQPVLYDLNQDVCRQAAISLGRIGNKSAIIALDKSLRSPKTPLSLKIYLVKALAWSENTLALDCLQEAIHREDILVCQEIIVILGRISSSHLQSRAIAILQSFWHSTPSQSLDFESKKALAMAFGELHAIEAKDILEQLTLDEHKMVKLHAIASLKKLKNME